MNLTRLATFIRWDILLQFRQGLYYAMAFVILFWCGLISLLPSVKDALLPFALFIDLASIGFFFVVGLQYLEKGEGTLSALIVSPFHTREYLLARVFTMLLMSLVASAAVSIFAIGMSLNWLLVGTATSLFSILFTLLATVIGSRYDDISSFLIPAILITVVLQIPLLDYFNILPHWLHYLFPTQPFLLLMAWAVGLRELATWQVIYAWGYQLVAIVAFFWLAQRALERFAVRAVGSR